MAARHAPPSVRSVMIDVFDHPDPDRAARIASVPIHQVLGAAMGADDPQQIAEIRSVLETRRHDPVVVGALPDQMAISAITAAELAAGPHLAATSTEAAKRQARLQEIEAKLEPLRFDGAAARS